MLITGFGPFKNIPVNPSWQVVKQFDGNTCGPFVVKTAELPVEYGQRAPLLLSASPPAVPAYRAHSLVGLGSPSGTRLP